MKRSNTQEFLALKNELENCSETLSPKEVVNKKIEYSKLKEQLSEVNLSEIVFKV